MQVQGTGLSKQFKPYELCCDLGYNITDNLYADLRYENAIALFKENGVKDYAHSHIVGLNLGYIVYHTENCNIGAQVGYGSNMKRKIVIGNMTIMRQWRSPTQEHAKSSQDSDWASATITHEQISTKTELSSLQVQDLELTGNNIPYNYPAVSLKTQVIL